MHVGCREGALFCFGCFFFFFFFFCFSHLFSQGNRTYCLAKTRQVNAWLHVPGSHSKHALESLICFGASGQQGQLECCYFLFQIKEAAPRYHRNHQPNYKEFCSLDKSHHFFFLPTLVEVPKILAWIWLRMKGFAPLSKMITGQ